MNVSEQTLPARCFPGGVGHQPVETQFYLGERETRGDPKHKHPGVKTARVFNDCRYLPLLLEQFSHGLTHAFAYVHIGFGISAVVPV